MTTQVRAVQAPQSFDRPALLPGTRGQADEHEVRDGFVECGTRGRAPGVPLTVRIRGLKPGLADDMAYMEVDRNAFPYEPWPLKNYEAFFQDPDTHALLAYDGTRPVGNAVVRYGHDGHGEVADKSLAYLHAMGVKYEAHSRGVGKQLLASALSMCVHAGIASCVLIVRDNNEVGKALYRKFGFHETGESESEWYEALGRQGTFMRLDGMQTPAFHQKLYEIQAGIEQTNKTAAVVPPRLARPSQAVLEPVNAGNAREAADLAQSVFPYVEARAGFAAATDPTFPREKLLASDERGPHNIRYWAARDPDTHKMIGTTGLYEYPDDKDAAWLGWFCVSPEARGKGVATQMLDFTIDKARQEGKKFIRLYTSDHPNESEAQELYEKYGFKVTGTEPCHGALEPWSYVFRELKL